MRNVNRPGDLPDRVSAMTIPEIDVDELAARLESGAVLFDVREPDEYTEAHVRGAVLVPLATVPDARRAVPPRRSGARDLPQRRALGRAPSSSCAARASTP